VIASEPVQVRGSPGKRDCVLWKKKISLKSNDCANLRNIKIAWERTRRKEREKGLEGKNYRGSEFHCTMT